MKYCRIRLKTPGCVGTSFSKQPFLTRTLRWAILVSSNRCRRRDLDIGHSSCFVHRTHLVESSESPAFLGSSELFCSSSRSASFSADPDPPPPSLAAGPDGPGKEAESEVPAISLGAAVCMIFWRTSRIFNCKHTLVGKISAYRAWNAAVAWATEENIWNLCKDYTRDFLHEHRRVYLGYASFRYQKKALQMEDEAVLIEKSLQCD